MAIDDVIQKISSKNTGPNNAMIASSHDCPFTVIVFFVAKDSNFSCRRVATIQGIFSGSGSPEMLDGNYDKCPEQLCPRF